MLIGPIDCSKVSVHCYDLGHVDCSEWSVDWSEESIDCTEGTVDCSEGSVDWCQRLVACYNGE